MVHNEPTPIKGKTMKFYEEESYMFEDDRYDRTCYSTYYTMSVLDHIKNFLRTFYSPKK
jgi:hypothetical protein